VHGTAVLGQDDRDEMGLCLEPVRFVTGLARCPTALGPSVRSSSTRGIQRGTSPHARFGIGQKVSPQSEKTRQSSRQLAPLRVLQRHWIAPDGKEARSVRDRRNCLPPQWVVAY
jgi:hypothetical protein